jgi:hypothetical protein
VDEPSRNARRRRTTLRARSEKLRGRSGRSHVMGVIELLILAFLVGIPALIVADGL